MGRRLAVLIGVNQYHDPTFQPLQYAETDARALAQWLVNVQGGKWNPPDVQLILGSLATRELVESLITQVCVSMAGPDDLVFIYFAGHAFLDERQGDGYLALTNTRYQQPETGIQLGTLIQQTVARSRAAHVLVMFDYFQSGRLWSTRRSTPYDSKPLLGQYLLQTLQKQSDRIFFCSCRGNEMASESGERNLGQLVHRMILGLCGPARDTLTGQTTLQQLHAYLFNVLPEQQRPQIFGQEQSQMVLIGDMSQPTPSQPPTQPLPGFPSGITKPTYPEAMRSTGNTGNLAQQTGNAAAVAQMSPSLATQGQTPEQQQAATLLKQARYLVQMQNPAEALRLSSQAIQFDPNNLDAYILKGQLLGASSRFQEAIAVIDQAMQLNPNNALVWSMKAALLTNLGQYQEALTAADRSLQIDPGNPETNSIKGTIMSKLIETTGKKAGQGTGSGTRFESKVVAAPTPILKWISIGGLGLVIGLVGIILLIALTSLPAVIGLALASFGLAILAVNAAVGVYKAGFGRFVLVILNSIITAIAGGILAAASMGVGLHNISTMLASHPTKFLPTIALSVWLLMAAIIPLLAGLSGLIGGTGYRKRAKKQ